MKRADRWQRQEERAEIFDNVSFNFFDDEKNEEAMQERTAGKVKRRTTMIETVSEKYLLRRAFSEVSLLEAMRYEPLTAGSTYWFITGGDCDALRFLKIGLNGHKYIEKVIISTWVIGAEDLLQLRQWSDEGRIGYILLCVGDIFPNQYRIEYALARSLFQDESRGRLVVFNNHSKIIAMKNSAIGYYYCAACSANVNTNPRTEQAVVACDGSLYLFYEEFFEDIKSWK